MANPFNSYLNNNAPGPDLRDWQHAARMFTDNNQIYGPKQKFLFHVAINLNQNALRNTTLAQNYAPVLGMLVKNVNLPRFTMQVDKVNQYNRKKNIQQKVTYEDITITFHDDNLGLINQLWQNYFNYYYGDSGSSTIPGAYNRTATKNFSSINGNYGLDNGATAPFFNYITLYQMAQGQYVSYKLINPLVTSWNHEQVAYDQSQAPHFNTMTLAFEAVEYGQGPVTPGDPEGFDIINYDQSASPLSALNSTSTPAEINLTPNLNNINVVANNSTSILNNAVQTVNTYQNGSAPIAPAGTPGAGTAAPSSTGGLPGFAFPTNTTTANTTAATPSNVSQ